MTIEQYKHLVTKKYPEVSIHWHSECYYTIETKNKRIGFGITELIAWKSAYDKYCNMDKDKH